MRSLRRALLGLTLGLCACSPRLDWREVRPDGAGVLALFPCQPDLSAHAPTVAEPVRMGLAQCEAGGQSFSLSWAELDDPSRAGAVLRQMRESLAAKLAAVAGPARPLDVPGMTPNPEAQYQRLTAAQQQAQVGVFTHGRRVYQAVMLGTAPNDAAWENFVGALRLAP